MIPHVRILKEAVERTREKDAHYGLNEGLESWETMKLSALADAVSYKVNRAVQPGTSFAKSKDDLEDAYNYCAALYERILRAKATGEESR